MQWLALSYSLPSGRNSSPRVNLWRRLRRLGSISPTSSLYVLPAREECLEAFQWLAQEIRQAQGDVLLMHVESFEGLSDIQVIELFQSARARDYAEIDAQATTLEQTIGATSSPGMLAQLQEALERLRRRYTEIARVDYFSCPDGAHVGARLHRIAQTLQPGAATVEAVLPITIADYRDRIWVTRPRPHVDRLACAWLIRRYLNPDAVIRYANEPEPEEVAFDMPGALFGHHGDRCTFETMLTAFGLADPALHTLAAIVHEIDLRDGRESPPEVAGVDAILRGWLQVELSDSEREMRGLALFDGLYAALKRR